MGKSLFLAVVLCVFGTIMANTSPHVVPPHVEVYTRNPGEFGKENSLICHVKGFHPPDIKIELLKDDMEIPDAKQTDLAFEDSWQFHLTKTVAFTPRDGEKYQCRVTHLSKAKTFNWEPDM